MLITSGCGTKIIRMYLDNDRIDRQHSIGRLFFITGLYDSPDLGKIALEYDMKSKIRVINRELYYSALKTAVMRLMKTHSHIFLMSFHQRDIQ
jgi:hypothetical protein